MIFQENFELNSKACKGNINSHLQGDSVSLVCQRKTLFAQDTYYTTVLGLFMSTVFSYRKKKNKQPALDQKI